MLRDRLRVVWICLPVFVGLCSACAGEAPSLEFHVSLKAGVVSAPQTGRLIVIIARENQPEPRLTIDRARLDGPFMIARDVDNFKPGDAPALLNSACLTSPRANLADLPPGDYFAQALLTSNNDLRSPAAPGNLYSQSRRMHLDPNQKTPVPLELSARIPDEEMPEDHELIKFVKIKSELLSDFHKRPIFLRAGVILPQGYYKHAGLKYPLWVRIGGLNARYTSVFGLKRDTSDFGRAWREPNAPQMILLQLDGAGPYGDPYQVNSANNGPYGDAVTQELIPYVEDKFHAIGKPSARVLSGLSTGGWASLALQVFHPDFFNGTWTYCPDGVDFRAFELVNIYEDTNAYVNEFGLERPSDRALNGDVRLTMRLELLNENVRGGGGNWTLSGGQWGAWNAVYGPRGKDGLPVPLWDPVTGVINHDAANAWKKYDLRMVMQDNWQTIGPKLRGKLHISVGESDNYFLNNAVHYLDEFLSQSNPSFDGRVVYGPGKGHGWRDISYSQMMIEMNAATGGPQ